MLNHSWHVGRPAGIDLRIHWTFLLLPVWIYFSSLAAGSGAAAATLAVTFVLAIFGCVVLHELGHALTARRFGIGTRDITLLPIGGVASLQRMPRSPWQELAIALAGPAVNVVIAVALFVVLPLLGAALPATALAWLSRLAWVNVALVVFNMVPAFPMDGGRVLRAALALALPYRSATRVAVAVGQAVALGLAVLGLMSGNLMMILVAGFVFLAARGEGLLVEQEHAVQPQAVPPLVGVDQLVEANTAASLLDADGREIGMVPVRSLPVVSAQWAARNVLRWLSSSTVDEFLVSSQGVAVAVVRKCDLRQAVTAGLGALPIEQLLANRFVPFVPYRGLPQGMAS